METNIKAIQITAKDATYVNIGVVLVNPDGKSVTRFAPLWKEYIWGKFNV